MDTKIEKANYSYPIYMQVSDKIMKAIENGEYQIGSIFLSERKLMRLFDISRATVQQALKRLESLGYVSIEHGRGTFVKIPTFIQDDGGFYSFTNEMEKRGKKPSNKVLLFRIVQADDQLVSIMHCNKSDFLFKFIRVRFAEGEPIILEYTYLPYSRFETLQYEDVQNFSLLEIMTKWYRTPLTKAEETFRIIELNEFESTHLSVSMNSKALEKNKVSYSNDQVVEYTRSICVTSDMSFKVVIHA